MSKLCILHTATVTCVLALCVLASLLEFEKTTLPSFTRNKVYNSLGKYSYPTFVTVEIALVY